MKKIVLISTASLLFVCVSTGYAVTPSFKGLGDLDGGLCRSYATGISGDGSVVVGVSYASTGIQTFRWTASEGIIAVNGLVSQTAQSSTFPKISSDGSTIVGQVGNEAARWTATEGVQPLGVLGGLWEFSSTATGASGDGSVVVGYSTNNPPIDNEAFRWTDTDGMQGLGFSPTYQDKFSRAFAVSGDGSVIVGSSMHYYYGLAAEVAVRWTAEDGMVPLLDTQGNYIAHTATDISADGSVIVGNGRGPTPWQAFRWTSEDNIEPLGFLDNVTANCYAWGVSGNGEIIVGDCGDKAYIWDEINGMRSIQKLLTEDYGLDLSGWTLHRAYATNYDGTTIAGTGFNPNGDIEAWVAVIPEPTTLSLLAIGGLLLRRRKK